MNETLKRVLKLSQYHLMRFVLVTVMVLVALVLTEIVPWARYPLAVFYFSLLLYFFYANAWTEAYSDRNKINIGNIENVPLKGLYSALIVAVPAILLAALRLVLSATAVKLVSAAVSFSGYFMYISFARSNVPLQIILFAATMLCACVASQVGYYFGAKNISLWQKARKIFIEENKQA